ncbi:DUF1488 family protein [Mesorhizobium sp. A623]
MALSFLNPSRTYDKTRRSVHFTAHDGMFEIRFFVEVAALLSILPGAVKDEAGYLKAFDTMRDAIHEAARRAYSSGSTNMYTLTSVHFRRHLLLQKG